MLTDKSYVYQRHMHVVGFAIRRYDYTSHIYESKPKILILANTDGTSFSEQVCHTSGVPDRIQNFFC